MDARARAVLRPPTRESWSSRPADSIRIPSVDAEETRAQDVQQWDRRSYTE
ncbi:MAG: hypothetical protein ACREM3_04710 [Candidatus Rokuibacteriota bacterium]